MLANVCKYLLYIYTMCTSYCFRSYEFVPDRVRTCKTSHSARIIHRLSLSFCWGSCHISSTGCIAILSTIPHLHSSKWILLITSYFWCVCQPIPSISSYSKALFSCPALAKAFVQCQSCNSCRPHGTCPRNPMDPLGVLAVLLISGLCRHDSRKGNS